MPTKKQLENIKAQMGHAFEVDINGNLTLKPHFNIPPFKLIFVEGGEFIMGDGKMENEPKHKVEVSSFFMAEHQLTQEVYKAVTDKEPSDFTGINHPVEQVSWIDAVGFCNKLNGIIGLSDVCDKDYNFLGRDGKRTNNIADVQGFRLPTEAEWEYAARGGGGGGGGVETHGRASLQYAGSNNLDDVGWYDDNNKYETKPVGLRFPNHLGLYDMSGNVWEWCWDWYEEDLGTYVETGKVVYSVDRSNAPVIEFSPSFIRRDGRLVKGRIWAEMYRLEGGTLVYKGADFEAWYDRIVRWLRRRFRRVEGVDGYFGQKALEWYREGGKLSK